MTDTYKSNWESLVQHQVPEWVLDAKFGIYAHWGIYSVPAFGNEWYARNMYRVGSPEHDHFVSTYGELGALGYKDLVPRFTAEKLDPEQWAEIIAQSGAKYGGISLVHHDGFLLWDCRVNRWNAANVGPRRDLYGELVQAIRKRGLRISATFHHLRTFNWYLPGSGGLGEAPTEAQTAQARQSGWDILDPAYADLYWNEYTGRYEDFVAEWKAKVLEVIDRYQPDLMWFDGGRFKEPQTRDAVCSVLAHYFNQSLSWGRGVTVLNKLPTSMMHNFPRAFGVLTFEQGRDRPPGIERPWIDDINIAKRSWGYIEGQEYRSPTYILRSLIDAASRGGGIFLSLAPRADGTIPEEQVGVLADIGDWLRVNGEAIHGTRPWRIQAEGDIAKIWSGKLGTGWRFDRCDASDIRFVRKGHTLYAITLGWPEGNKLDILSLRDRTHLGTGDIRTIRLLGHDERLVWTRDNQGLHIDLPPEKPHEHAYAFEIQVDGELEE